MPLGSENGSCKWGLDCQVKTLCTRFLDKQKFDILRHSSTASRLSHKMACSIAVNHGYECEAWDISTALLQGLEFSKVQQKAKELGHDIHFPRHVYMTPPPDVWRILHQLASNHFPRPEDAWNSLLEMLKAAYGLVDAPLLWQMSSLKYIQNELKAKQV